MTIVRSLSISACVLWASISYVTVTHAQAADCQTDNVCAVDFSKINQVSSMPVTSNTTKTDDASESADSMDAVNSADTSQINDAGNTNSKTDKPMVEQNTFQNMPEIKVTRLDGGEQEIDISVNLSNGDKKVYKVRVDNQGNKEVINTIIKPDGSEQSEVIANDESVAISNPKTVVISEDGVLVNKDDSSKLSVTPDNEEVD